MHWLGSKLEPQRNKKRQSEWVPCFHFVGLCFCAPLKLQFIFMSVKTLNTHIFGDEIYCLFSTIYLGKIAPHFLVWDKYLLKILLAVSTKAVTRKWLQATPPTETDWIDIVTNIQNMERVTFSLSQRMDRYLQYWEKWIVFVKTRDAHWAITVWNDLNLHQYVCMNV